jgi:hypothetical protein
MITLGLFFSLPCIDSSMPHTVYVVASTSISISSTTYFHADTLASIRQSPECPVQW